MPFPRACRHPVSSRRGSLSCPPLAPVFTLGPSCLAKGWPWSLKSQLAIGLYSAPAGSGISMVYIHLDLLKKTQIFGSSSFVIHITYSFGKMDSQKCKLRFIILQINLVLGSTNFIGIMNQVHYIDNQINFNFQPISLRVVNKFVIWFPYSQLHKNDFMKCRILFHNVRYIMHKVLLIAPHK